MKTINHDILKTFIPLEDLENFLAFEHIIVNDENIILFYRAPLSEKIIVNYAEYKLLEIQMNRNNKLEIIL